MSFYKIDFTRELVLYGKTTTWINLGRNPEHDNIDVVGEIKNQKFDIYAIIYPSTRTFNHWGTFKLVDKFPSPISSETNKFILKFDNTNKSCLNSLKSGLIIKNAYRLFNDSDKDFIPIELEIKDYYYEGDYIYVKIETNSSYFDVNSLNGIDEYFQIGEWDNNDILNWKINGRDVKDIIDTFYLLTNTYKINIKNLFDGREHNTTTTIDLLKTGFFSRKPKPGWIKIPYDSLQKNKVVPIRIDYDGEKDSHLCLKFLIFRVPKDNYDNPYFPNSSITPVKLLNISSSSPQPPESGKLFGLNTPTNGEKNPFIDFQVVDFFGYKNEQKNVELKTNNYLNREQPLYGNLLSKSLYRTNPKLTGNVKITIDSDEKIWLNSFDANNELSKSRYKKFKIKENSSYALDLMNFFKNTPKEIIFNLYELDNNFSSTKRELYKKYDNFYVMGAEQLKSKYYPEQYSYLAPLWVNKILPDYFIIFKINSTKIYENSQENFNDLIKNGKILKVFNLTKDSEIGKYLRNIQKNVKKPLEVNFEENSPTYWYGADIIQGTYTKKAEFLHDYYKNDQAIIEFEKYMTLGFERNSIICPNILNLEFLFDDKEAEDFTISQYIGLYVLENELCNFNISIDSENIDNNPIKNNSQILNNDYYITNENGIRLKIENSNEYIRKIEGELPPSNILLDNRFFYLKDKESFSRLIGIENDTLIIDKKKINLKNFLSIGDLSFQSFIDYRDGFAVLELLLDDIEEDNENIIKEGEELVFYDSRFIDDNKNNTYTLIFSKLVSSDIEIQVFTGHTELLTSIFVQPNENLSFQINVQDAKKYSLNSYIWITNGGEYKIIGIDYVHNKLEIENTGNAMDATPGTLVNNLNLICVNKPFLRKTFSLSSTNNYFLIDNRFKILYDTIPNVLDSYIIDVKENYYNLTKLNTASLNIDLELEKTEKNAKWKIIANSNGLQPGDWWDFPVYDPQENSYINVFSPEGSPEQVAQAIAGCINSFENIPIIAKNENRKVKLRTKEVGEKANAIQFERIPVKNSIARNISIFDWCNVSIKKDLEISNNIENTILNIKINDKYEFINDTTYYVKFIKTPTNAIFYIRKNADISNLTNAENSGELFIEYTNFLNLENYPFVIDTKDYSPGTYRCAFVFSSKLNKQNFIGGSDHKNNSFLIEEEKAKQIFNLNFVNKKILNINNKLLTLENTDGIRLGMKLYRNGVYLNSWVQKILGNTIKISNPINEYDNVDFSKSNFIGEEKYNLWAKTKKDSFHHIKKWNIQDSFCYVFPDYDSNSYILNISESKELNTNYDDILSLYDIFRLKLGIFSIFPISYIDFDHFSSNYSYIPDIEINNFYRKIFLKKDTWEEIELNEDYILEISEEIDNIEDILLKFQIFSGEEWLDLDTIQLKKCKNKIRFNTYFPLYSYDPLENPHRKENPNIIYEIFGFGNFQRNLTTKDEKILKIYSIRIKYIPNLVNIDNDIKVVLYKNYLEDKDIKNFTGFNSLNDIITQEDEIETKKLLGEEKFIEAFNYNKIDSEYFYLREPFTKEYCTLSKTTPWITKWVSDGTDARDNKYRLNVSKGFGINNLSPNSEIKIQLPELFTHEFFYLEGIPNSSNEELILSSKGYTFRKLNEKIGEKTFYEYLKEENSEIDWFSKFFIVGSPFLIKNKNVIKSREEKYTFLNKLYDNAYETIFRGVKIRFFSEKNLEDYRFSSVMRFIEEEPYKSANPINLEFIVNHKHKFILVLCSISLNDYRFNKYLNFLSLYCAKDNLKSCYQKQEEYNYNPLSFTGLELHSKSQNIKGIYPYDDYEWDNVTNQGAQQKNYMILRPRQGLMGSSFVDINDIKIPSKIYFDIKDLGTIVNIMIPDEIRFEFDIKPIEGIYKFNPNKDVVPIKNLYRNLRNNIYKSFEINTLSYSNDISSSINISKYNNVIDTNFDKDGIIFGLVNVYQRIDSSTSEIIERIHLFRQYSKGNIQILPNKIIFNSTYGKNFSVVFRTILNSFIPTQVLSISNNYDPDEYIDINNNDIVESWIMKGGTDWCKNILENLSLASIFDLINDNQYSINDTNLKIKFIKEDKIIKNDTLFYVEDENKPSEYINHEIIGYELKETGKQTLLLRHRGFYEPLINDLILFQKEEDEEIIKLKNDSLLLRNTKILNTLDMPLMVHKVADSEILKIVQNDSYKNLYPFVDEISIAREIGEPFLNNFGKNFYTKYINTREHNLIDGYFEEKEIKVPMSKMLKVPETIVIDIFKNISYKIEGNNIEFNLNWREELLEKLLLEDNNKSFQEINGLVNDLNQWRKNYYIKNILELYEISKIDIWTKKSEILQVLNNLTLEERVKNGFLKNREGFNTEINVDGSVKITKKIDQKNTQTFLLLFTIKRI